MADGEGRETAANDRDGLQSLKALVDELYRFRDHYFDTHAVEDAGRKQGDVAQEMERTLKRLEEEEDRYRHDAAFLLLKGRALSVSPGFSAAAEALLSRAVKLQPELVPAWNCLGEQYWRKGDLNGAKTCFTGALQHCKNKESLRSLSMVLRQLPGRPEEREAHVVKSLDCARQALQLDITDGTSWYILGNAYISLFFSSGQTPQLSQQALSAYTQAEKVDSTASSNPDLHFNRATLYQYEEMFGAALAGFCRAGALDPGWSEPAQREKQLLEYLERLTTLLGNKGKVRGKKLQSMLASLGPAALGPCSGPQYRSPSGRVGSLETRSISGLSLGPNPGAAALGRVVFSLASADRMSFTFGLVDSEGSCCAVMVYNSADSWGVLIGDAVAIPEPQLRLHSISHKDQSFEFRSIRVDSPLLLIVNGKKQGAASQSVASVTYTPQSD